MRLARLFTLLFVLVLLSAGALQAQDEKVLVVGHAESTDSLDPAHGYTQTTGIVEQITYDTLVTFPKDSAATIEPRLATSWTISEDGLTYTFTLRDAKFSDGNPVTADDVVFSFNRLKYVKGNPSYLTDGIASIEATDAKTVTITLRTSTAAKLTVGRKHYTVRTRSTKITLSLPAKPAVGLVKVPFTLAPSSHSVTGKLRGSVWVVRT